MKPDSIAFNLLWSNHKTEIEYLAGRLLKWRANNLDLLLSAARVALWEASLKYDADHSQGASFWTFAEYRVRGAMLDEIRSWDHVGYKTRDKIKDEDIEKFSWGLIHRRSITSARGVPAAGDDPEKLASAAEKMHQLEVAIEQILTPTEKLITKGILVGGVPVRVMAQELGVTQGRVSQMKAIAADKLREHLRDRTTIVIS